MRIEDKAILSTFIEYFRSYNDTSLVTANLKSDPNSSLAFSGSKEILYNSIFLQDPSDYQQLTQELRTVQQQLNLPLTAWITSDTAHSQKLDQILKKYYSSPGEFYGMLLDLNQATLSRCPDNITIEQVKNKHQAAVYAEIFSKTFNFPDLLKPTVHWVLNQSNVSYIASVDGTAAGVCSIVFNNKFNEFKTGGLYNGCVLPQFRKLGVGTAMACHRVTIAKVLGLKYLSIVLMSGAMARSYCERLGFVNHQTMTPYYIP